MVNLLQNSVDFLSDCVLQKASTIFYFLQQMINQSPIPWCLGPVCCKLLLLQSSLHSFLLCSWPWKVYCSDQINRLLCCLTSEKPWQEREIEDFIPPAHSQWGCPGGCVPRQIALWCLCYSTFPSGQVITNLSILLGNSSDHKLLVSDSWTSCSTLIKFFLNRLSAYRELSEPSFPTKTKWQHPILYNLPQTWGNSF
jgi:hypothetical protein